MKQLVLFFLFTAFNFGISLSQDVYTSIIQAKIDSISTSGGGELILESGKYQIGTLILKSGVFLHLKAGARLVGSTNPEDYPIGLGSFKDSNGKLFGSPLIYANKATDFGITGEGTIDGQGFQEFFPPDVDGVARPGLIRFENCSTVSLRNVRLLNSAAWVLHIKNSTDIDMQGITIESHANRNNDGIDIESCSDVSISNVTIDTEDDAIVLKTLGLQPVQNIIISNVRIKSLKSAFKIGTESVGDFRNIVFSQAVIEGSRGITLFSVDGAHISGVRISDVVMNNSYGVIMLRVGERLNRYNTPDTIRLTQSGSISNVSIAGLTATNVSRSTDFIAGLPESPIENIHLRDVSIEYTKAGLSELILRPIPEPRSAYPMHGMFGELPSVSFFIRHVKNSSISDIRVKVAPNEERPIFSLFSVENTVITSIQSQSSPLMEAIVFMKDSKRIFLRDIVVTPAKHGVWISGNSEGIHLPESFKSQSDWFISPHSNRLNNTVWWGW
jgi:polygalacturonase